MLEQEIAGATRSGASLVVCMVNLDNFEAVIRDHGQRATDMAVSENGKTINNILRRGDMVCRYDNAVFAFLMPNSHLEGARIVCERIRKRIATQQFEYRSKVFRLTANAGISAYNSSIRQTPSDFLAVVARALRQAEKEGGNRVKISRFMPMDLFRPL